MRCVMRKITREREGGSDHEILFQKARTDSSMKDTNSFPWYSIKRKSDPA